MNRPGSSLPGWFLIIDIRHGLVVNPSKRGVKPSVGWYGVGVPRRSPRRRAKAMPVSIGFGDPVVGKRAGPTTYAFGSSQSAVSALLTDTDGPRSPIQRVPAS